MDNSNFYTEETARTRQDFFSLDISTDYVNDFFFTIVRKKLSEGNRVLDIGTGNGYVLHEVTKRFPELHLIVYGVDNSEVMLKEARGKLPEHAHVLCGDNYCLPFSDRHFDMVTAKNVTLFSPSEVYRVLRKSSNFVFREYGCGKGLVEIAEMFPSRLIRSRDSSFYLDSLKDAGFDGVSLHKLKFVKDYSMEQLLQILRMFPFIKDYSELDEGKIRAAHRGKSSIKITSDPIIIVGRKPE